MWRAYAIRPDVSENEAHPFPNQAQISTEQVLWRIAYALM